MSKTKQVHDKWYAVVLLFSSEVGHVPHLRPLCEERVVLFRGKGPGEVERLARKYGHDEEHSYRNVDDETVRWRFEVIQRIDLLDDPADKNGWEVASRFTRRSLAAIRRASSKLARRDP